MIESIDLMFSHRQTKLLKNAVNNRINKVIDSNNFIMGNEVRELEQELSNYTGFDHAIACANGTDALTLALMSFNISVGDIVFTPSFTYVATAEAIKILGAKPFFVDVGYDYNIDCNSLEAAILDAKGLGLRCSAIISVDLFGLPANHNDIKVLADKYNLYFISDGAQSFGALYNNKATGSLANITTTSFFPTKPLGCWGDGGMLFTNDDKLANLLRSLTLHGKGKEKYHHINVGMNSRLDTLQAVVLLEKLIYFPKEIETRDQTAQYYNKNLANYIDMPKTTADKTSVWAVYQLRHSKRNTIIKELNKKEIPSGIYYPTPLHLQPAYDNCLKSKSLEKSEQFCKEVFCLPMHAYLEKDETKYIVESLQKVLLDL